jgi:hypothetical protein
MTQDPLRESRGSLRKPQAVAIQQLEVRFVGIPATRRVESASGVSGVEVEDSVSAASSAAAFSRFGGTAAPRSHQPGVDVDARGTVKINHARDLDYETNCRCVTAFQGEDDGCRLSGVLSDGTARRVLYAAGGVSAFGVSDDAAALANSILMHKASFRLGFALSLISLASYVAVTALFYQLFAPVSRSLSLVAVFFSLVGLSVQACGSLLQLAPLVIVGDSPYLSVFSVAQLQALALMFLNLNAQVGSISLVFDGLFCS